MDDSRDSCYKKNIHATTNCKNETGSGFSSDSDQTPKPSQKKRKEKKSSKQFYTPDYFPMYTPPWATMNYMYLDLLRQLSLESEIRSSLTKMDHKYDYSYLKDCQAKNKFEEEQCCDRRRIKYKPTISDDFEMPCSHLCLSCHQQMKCSACGQTIMQSREPETAAKDCKPFKHCKCFCDSCPPLLDLQHVPVSYCHYHCQTPTHPCHSLSHQVCSSLNHVSIDTLVREVPELFKSTRRAQNTLDTGVCDETDSNLDELLRESCSSTDNSIPKNLCTKIQPVLEIANKDVMKHDFEDDYGIVPSFLGGTGDEGSKIQVKRTRKSLLPQSTAYFLPISSLSSK